MPEIGEEIKVIVDFLKEEDLCKHKAEPENNGWQCRIGKKGSPGDLDDPTAERLYENMKKGGVFTPSNPPKIGSDWDLDQCTPAAFPFQSHHLIPKMHLPKHDVCVWLAKKAANKAWKLTESTNYDTDDARNGMALPFASNTHQWNKHSSAAKHDLICNIMMFKTGMQLHQGSHTYTDYGEEDSLHAKEESGYLGAVDQLLKMINGETLNHVTGCGDCKKNQTKPIEVRPLERVILSVHKVSSLMGTIITKRKRFVSKRAAAYTKPSVLTV